MCGVVRFIRTVKRIHFQGPMGILGNLAGGRINKHFRSGYKLISGHVQKYATNAST